MRVPHVKEFLEEAGEEPVKVGWADTDLEGGGVPIQFSQKTPSSSIA